MKRRTLIKNGLLALGASTLITPFNSRPSMYFVGAGTNAGGMLESLYRNGARGKYSWLPNDPKNKIQIPNIETIYTDNDVELKGELPHFKKVRVQKLEEMWFSNLSEADRSFYVVLADSSVCTWSLILLSSLMSLFELKKLNYRCIVLTSPHRRSCGYHARIMSSIIHYFPGRVVQTAAEAVREFKAEPLGSDVIPCYNNRVHLEFERMIKPFGDRSPDFLE